MRCLLALLVAALALPPAAAHPEDPDCVLATDAGDSWSMASAVAVPVACAGQLHSSWDSTDYYKFFCDAGQRFRAVVTSPSPAVNLRAYLPVYTPVPVHLAWTSTQATGTAVIEVTCHVFGDYRIQLLHGGLDPGLYDVPYTLDLSFV